MKEIKNKSNLTAKNDVYYPSLILPKTYFRKNV